jgi:hypothetical protein
MWTLADGLVVVWTRGLDGLNRPLPLLPRECSSSSLSSLNWTVADDSSGTGWLASTLARWPLTGPGLLNLLRTTEAVRGDAKAFLALLPGREWENE